jgi:hypothetical protein
MAHLAPFRNSNSLVHRRLTALVRLLGKRVYVLLCRILRLPRKAYLRSQYLHGEVTPWEVLQGCLADIGTALYRIGQRIDKLPYCYTCPIAPYSERAPIHSLTRNTLAPYCMSDMQSFESHFPKATEFDWEMFVIGWYAGAKSGACIRDGVEREQSAYNSTPNSAL